MSEEIAVAAPVARSNIMAGAKALAIVPTSMDEAFRMARGVRLAGWCPQFKTDEEAFGAIMHGLEVGITPMQAVSGIAMINGKPAIYGDLMTAVVRGSGTLEDIKEYETSDEGGTAWCQVRRRGEATPTVRKFSVADAQRAKLWGKAGPWTQYPTRMLFWRARAWAFRDAFGDVLKGLQMREEVQDIPTGPDHAKDVTPPRKTEAPQSNGFRIKADAPPPAKPAADPVTGEIVEPVVKESLTAEKLGKWLAHVPNGGGTPSGDDWLSWRNFLMGLLANNAEHYAAIEAANREAIARSPHRADIAAAVEAAKQQAALAS